MGVIQDIPKFYTALAEWLACLVFVVLLPKRYGVRATTVIMCISFGLICFVQYLIGIVPLYLWIPGMMLALIIMYATIYICCQVLILDAGFYWAIIFIAAEFAASLEWQFYSFFMGNGFDNYWIQALFLVLFYGAVFCILYQLERNWLRDSIDLRVSGKEVLASTIIAVGAFLISNISYVMPNTPLSGSMSAEIFYIRTLVDLAGLVMLYSYQNRCKEMQMQQELESIHSVLRRQYEMYQQSKESIEVINRKYHDLKHQIGIIRMERDEQKREEYLQQIESDLISYEAQHKTGNSVLDTILTTKQLYCQQHGINLTVVADGLQLQFMEVMDICSIFGNALDNAIESVEKLRESEKRLIRLALYVQNDFLMIRVENYFENPIESVNGEFVTSKKNKDYHGYGIKSIRYTAEKYGGSLSITMEENWFYLRVLIPVPKKDKQIN